MTLLTARVRALSIPLVPSWCSGECSGDAVLCKTHMLIQQAIEDAVRAEAAERQAD